MTKRKNKSRVVRSNTIECAFCGSRIPEKQAQQHIDEVHLTVDVSILDGDQEQIELADCSVFTEDGLVVTSHVLSALEAKGVQRGTLRRLFEEQIDIVNRSEGSAESRLHTHQRALVSEAARIRSNRPRKMGKPQIEALLVIGRILRDWIRHCPTKYIPSGFYSWLAEVAFGELTARGFLDKLESATGLRIGGGRVRKSLPPGTKNRTTLGATSAATRAEMNNFDAVLDAVGDLFDWELPIFPSTAAVAERPLYQPKIRETEVQQHPEETPLVVDVSILRESEGQIDLADCSVFTVEGLEKTGKLIRALGSKGVTKELLRSTLSGQLNYINRLELSAPSRLESHQQYLGRKMQSINQGHHSGVASRDIEALLATGRLLRDWVRHRPKLPVPPQLYLWLHGYAHGHLTVQEFYLKLVGKTGDRVLLSRVIPGAGLWLHKEGWRITLPSSAKSNTASRATIRSQRPPSTEISAISETESPLAASDDDRAGFTPQEPKNARRRARFVAGSNELLIAVRRILNETRQDRLCRPLLEKRETGVVIPFLGCPGATYFFLGACPVGYELEGIPHKAKEYIDYATGYFDRQDTNKAPFVHCLPFTANHHEDYPTFGQLALVGNIVPVPAERSTEVSVALLEQCWPRMANLILAVKPKMLLCHGSTTWKFLAGLEDGQQPALTDVPEGHRMPLKDVYQKVPASDLPFKTALRDIRDFSTWVLPLPNLGKSAPARADREKGEEGLAQARRLAYDQPSRSRIRVRHPPNKTVPPSLLDSLVETSAGQLDIEALSEQMFVDSQPVSFVGQASPVIPPPVPRDIVTEPPTVTLARKLDLSLDLSTENAQSDVSRVPSSSGPQGRDFVDNFVGPALTGEKGTASNWPLCLHLSLLGFPCSLLPQIEWVLAYARALGNVACVKLLPVSPTWLSFEQAWNSGFSDCWKEASSNPDRIQIVVLQDFNRALTQVWARPLLNLLSGYSPILWPYDDRGWPTNLRLAFVPATDSATLPVSCQVGEYFGGLPLPTPLKLEGNHQPVSEFDGKCWLQWSEGLQPFEGYRHRHESSVSELALGLGESFEVAELLAHRLTKTWPATYCDE